MSVNSKQFDWCKITLRFHLNVCLPFQFVPILFVLSTSAMLILDQRTLQVKYRVPATEIYRLSLSPYLDDVAVFHVKAVSLLCIVDALVL